MAVESDSIDASSSVNAGTRPGEAKLLWLDARVGVESANRRLLDLCYVELRTIARRLLSGDRAAQRLQPTELAHEAALRLLKLDRMQWKDRAHFLATAATVMRQARLDEVRRHRASKRQLPPAVTTVFSTGASMMELDLEALDLSLRRLSAVSAERARLVELRFFVGLSIVEVAEVLGSSSATVKRQWDATRAWLLRDLSRGSSVR